MKLFNLFQQELVALIHAECTYGCECEKQKTFSYVLWKIKLINKIMATCYRPRARLIKIKFMVHVNINTIYIPFSQITITLIQ